MSHHPGPRTASRPRPGSSRIRPSPRAWPARPAEVGPPRHGRGRPPHHRITAGPHPDAETVLRALGERDRSRRLFPGQGAALPRILRADRQHRSPRRVPLRGAPGDRPVEGLWERGPQPADGGAGQANPRLEHCLHVLGAELCDRLGPGCGDRVTIGERPGRFQPDGALALWGRSSRSPPSPPAVQGSRCPPTWLPDGYPSSGMVNMCGVERDQLLLMPSLSEWLSGDHLAWFALDVVATEHHKVTFVRLSGGIARPVRRAPHQTIRPDSHPPSDLRRLGG